MTIEQMKARKKELGFTNETLAKATGVPLGTVQKIFAGTTKAPRLDTITALTRVLIKGEAQGYELPVEKRWKAPELKESTPDYAHIPDSFEWGTYRGRYTIDDYYALPDEQRVELIDGILYTMEAPNYKHQGTVLGILFQIKICLKQHKKKCRVFMAPCDVQLDQDIYTMVQPDIIVFCGDENFHNAVYFGAPDFVVEVLSKNSRRYDLFRKLDKYKSAGVREYWIVDPVEEKILAYAFEESDFPKVYEHDDKVPVAISKKKCIIDFKEVFDDIRDIPDDDIGN